MAGRRVGRRRARAAQGKPTPRHAGGNVPHGRPSPQGDSAPCAVAAARLSRGHVGSLVETDYFAAVQAMRAPVVTVGSSADDTYYPTIQAAREKAKRGACVLPVHVVCTAKRHPDLRVDKACRRGA